MGFLDIDNATKSYGSVEVLHKVDIAVEEGEFLVLVGPSGCGKSTLLNMIAGLEDITSGEIRIKDHVMNGVHPSKRNIAMVFQSYALYPNMTVGQNITFGLEMHGVPKPEREKAMAEVAKLLQIEQLLSRKPGQLSGGQRQRIAIARAILKEIRERLGFLVNVGLNYLTLSRSAGTLSGGESQRIRLASQIGSGLTGVLYVLDEPSIGLHQRDNASPCAAWISGAVRTG